MYYGYDWKEIEESLQVSDIITILQSLHADYKFGSGNADVHFNAICHSKMTSDEFKPNTFNLVYYGNIKKFVCYSGCCKKSYNIFDLIIKIFKTQYNEELSFHDAIEYVASVCHLEKKELNADNFKNALLDCTPIIIPDGWGHTYCFTKMGKEIKKKEREQEIIIEKQNEIEDFFNNGEVPILPELNEEFLSLYYEDFSKVSAYNYLWKKEGISLNVMKDYNIKFDNKNKEIIIPHYDLNHRLVGVRSRLLRPEQIERQGKYRPTYFKNNILSHPTSKVLYGLDKNYAEIQRTKKAIIFEAEKSVLQLASQLSDSKYNIGVAVCGSSISDTQLKLLKDLGVEEITIAFDKEFIKPKTGTLLEISNMEYINKYDEYLEKRKRLLNKVGKFFDVKFISDSVISPLLNYKDSPIDRGVEVFLKLYNKAILYKKEDFI